VCVCVCVCDMGSSFLDRGSLGFHNSCRVGNLCGLYCVNKVALILIDFVFLFNLKNGCIEAVTSASC
jgi:hypothetical protein